MGFTRFERLDNGIQAIGRISRCSQVAIVQSLYFAICFLFHVSFQACEELSVQQVDAVQPFL